MTIKVFYFRTTWCEICTKISPYYNWLSQLYKPNGFLFMIITLDDRKDLVKRFLIKEYPTFIIFKDNKEIYRQENADLVNLKLELDKLK